MLRAIANIELFQPGTNISAWLFTILHNLFRSEYRKRIREVEDTDGSYVGSLKSSPQQHSQVKIEEFRRALVKLIPDQREALILVGALGFSCEEAAAICGLPVARWCPVCPRWWRCRWRPVSGRSSKFAGGLPSPEIMRGIRQAVKYIATCCQELV